MCLLNRHVGGGALQSSLNVFYLVGIKCWPVPKSAGKQEHIQSQWTLCWIYFLFCWLDPVIYHRRILISAHRWIMVLYWVTRNRSWFLFLRCLLEDTDDVWIMSMMMETLLLLFIFRWFNIENYFEKSNKKNFKPFLLHPFHHHPEAAPTILLVRPGVSTRSEHPWSSSSDLVLPPGLWVFRLGVLRGDTSSFLYQLHHFNP